MRAVKINKQAIFFTFFFATELNVIGISVEPYRIHNSAFLEPGKMMNVDVYNAAKWSKRKKGFKANKKTLCKLKHNNSNLEGLSVHGIYQLEEGLERKKLVGASSYTLPAFQAEDKFFRDNPYRFQVWCSLIYYNSTPTYPRFLNYSRNEFLISPFNLSFLGQCLWSFQYCFQVLGA